MRSSLGERVVWSAAALVTAVCTILLTLAVVSLLEEDVYYVRAPTPVDREAQLAAWTLWMAFIAVTLLAVIWIWPRVAIAIPQVEISRSGIVAAGVGTGLFFWALASVGNAVLHFASSSALHTSPTTLLLSGVVALSFSLPRFLLLRLSPGTFCAQSVSRSTRQPGEASVE